ncbi:MAG: glycosyltransferase family 2 protein [Lachnospiraceae bacterium]|nr:glycosyltransferase family 2 protein [Lachnospiraceae bacterium]
MSGLLSVIIPSYNEEAMIDKAAFVIHDLLEASGIIHELLFIDDGSKDETWKEIQTVSENLFVVRGLHLSRNFGKESAIYAGLSYAEGSCCVVIDCDLQHPPEKIVEMYRLWEDGYEIVEAVKSDRGKESFFHSFCANSFYRVISGVTHIDMRHASDFKLLDSKAVKVLLDMKERNSFFRALSYWIGFKTVQIQFDVQERMEGVSKWSSWSLIKYAVSNVTSFSSAPMQLVTILGIVTFVISFIMGVMALVQKYMGQALEGFTTVIILLLITSSLIMTSLGIIGYYIAKIYDEIKGRPKFIISEKCGEGYMAKND